MCRLLLFLLLSICFIAFNRENSQFAVLNRAYTYKYSQAIVSQKKR